jgi:NADH-quinone oxidoreductase subunit N
VPLSAAVLTVSLLSLAGFPPFGGFVAKTRLFGAALGSGWTWLALVMGANVALSLYYYRGLRSVS